MKVHAYRQCVAQEDAGSKGRAPAARRWALPLCLGLGLVTTGCFRVSPTAISRDRFDYSEQLAESWKRQTLLNIVRLRYADNPVFLDVASVINSYSRGGALSAGAVLAPWMHPQTQLPMQAQGNWSNTPTVSYSPVTGDRFARTVLKPITPTTVFQLMQAGWSADLIFHLAVHSVNSLQNPVQGPGVVDPRYDQMVQALDRVSGAQALGLRLDEGKGGEVPVLVLMQKEAQAVEAELNTLRTLWKTDPKAPELTVTFGATQRNDRELAMVTRSMLEIMLALSMDIEVPAADLASHRAIAVKPGPRIQPLVVIHSGKSAPNDAYASVPYKGGWFWIDDADIPSKSCFTFLMILSSLAETGAPTGVPMITIPSR